MKNVLLLCFVGLLNFYSQAQFSKGSRMVGATIGAVYFNSAKTDATYPPPTAGYSRNEKNYGINLVPNYGCFISDNTVIGATMILSYDHNKIFSVDARNGNTYLRDQTTRFNIGFGAFGRNYFTSSGSWLPFGQAGFNFGITNSKNNGFYYVDSTLWNYDGKSSGGFFANAGLAFGLTKMFSNNVGLDLSLAYNFSYKKTDYNTKYTLDRPPYGNTDETRYDQPTQKYTNNGIVVGLGFQVFFDRKK